MSERRCPRCGGLVGRDAEWCGQCFTRLDEPGREGSLQPGEEPTPVAPAAKRGPGLREREGAPGVRVEGDRVLWTCPTCGSDNPIDARECGACGAPFGRLFGEAERRPGIPPDRAVRRSLLFPGLGHAATGRVADGLARGVVFAYSLATVVAIVVMRAGSGIGPFLALLVVSALAAVALYGLTAVDAGRAARGRPPILSTRMLLYGAGSLMLLTVAVLLITGIRASRGG